MTINRFAGDKFTGLSTDTKPSNVLDGAEFIELDTLKVFFYFDGQWRELETSAEAEWQIVSSSTTAEADTNYFVDVSSSSVTVTLPSSPTLGQTVIISDFKFNSATNAIVVNRNGANILGQAENLTIDVDGASVELVYSDSSTGWMIIQR